MCFSCVFRRLPPPRMNAIAARISNQMAARSPQSWVYGMKYAARRTNPPTALMSSGIVRFMPAGSSCEHRPHEKVEDRSDRWGTGQLGGRRGDHAHDDAGADEKLPHVLPPQAAELIRLSGQVGGGGEEFLA